MDTPIKILVGALLCLIALVIVVMVIASLTGDTQGGINSLFGWFSDLIGR